MKIFINEISQLCEKYNLDNTHKQMTVSSHDLDITISKPTIGNYFIEVKISKNDVGNFENYRGPIKLDSDHILEPNLRNAFLSAFESQIKNTK